MSFSLKPATPIGTGLTSFRGFGKFEDSRIIATVANGVLSLAINPTFPGDAYTSVPTITIPTAPAAVTALGTAVLTTQTVTSVTVGTAGNFYTSAPAVTFSGGGGTLAAATAVLNNNGGVASVTVTAAGSGYTSVPTVAFAAPPSAVNGSATAVLGGGYVISITPGGTNTGYTSTPAVAITGGGGSGAVAIAEMDLGSGKVTRFQVTNPGSGYTSTPTVTLTGGGFSAAATGTAIMAAPVASLTSVAGSGYTSVPNISITSPQVVIIKPNCWQISEVIQPATLGLFVAATDFLQWTFPSITQDGGFNGVQFGKSMLLPDNGSGNAIIAISRTTTGSFTKDLQFSAGWIG